MSWAGRRAALGVALTLGLAAVATSAAAAPSVTWLSEPAEPGDVVLVYGGDLAGVREVGVWRLGDGDPGAPPAQRAAPAPGGSLASSPPGCVRGWARTRPRRAARCRSSGGTSRAT
jgi:hypothetical protein